MKNKNFITACLFILFAHIGCIKSYDGEKIYQAQCANCHGKMGEGLKKLIPPIANSDFVRNNPDRLACIIKNGLKDTISVNGVIYYQKMAGNPNLTAVDIANLINYINKEWYKEKPFLNPDHVKDELEKCRE